MRCANKVKPQALGRSIFQGVTYDSKYVDTYIIIYIHRFYNFYLSLRCTPVIQNRLLLDYTRIGVIQMITIRLSRGQTLTQRLTPICVYKTEYPRDTPLLVNIFLQ